MTSQSFEIDIKCLRELIKNTPNAIIYFKNMPAELQILAFENSSARSALITQIHNPTKEFQIRAVKETVFYFKDPYIKYFPNACEEVQIAAITSSIQNLQYINSPTTLVLETAVKIDTDAMKYITSPGVKLQELAIDLNPTSIVHFKNIASPALQKKAIEKDPSCIRYVRQLPELQLLAVKQDPMVIRHIINPTEEAQLEAVSQNGMLIQFLRKIPRNARNHLQRQASYEVQLAAVKQNGLALQFIRRARREVQKNAVRQNADAFIYVKNPNLEIKLISV